MIDTTWGALTLWLACCQSLPLNCSPHTSPISEDCWDILDIGHAACCLISAFCRVGNKVAPCSWKSFILDIILRICLSCLLQVAQAWWGAFYVVKYCPSFSSDVSWVLLSLWILRSSSKAPSSFEQLWCLLMILEFGLLILVFSWSHWESQLFNLKARCSGQALPCDMLS